MKCANCLQSAQKVILFKIIQSVFKLQVIKIFSLAVKKALFVFCLLLLLGDYRESAANDVSNPNLSDSSFALRDSAIFHLVHQNYDQAKNLLKKYSEIQPSDNEAHYLSFVIDQTRILDYESYASNGTDFIAAADSLKLFFEKRLETLRGQDSIQCLFYIANIFGGVSIILSKTGNWFDAVKNAVNSVSILKKVKKLDPDCYEANLGIGVFNSYLSHSFKWLPFIQGKGKEGIKLVENALNARAPYNYAAKNSLCWILIEQGDLKRADSLARSALNELPDNTIFLRIRGYIALWNGEYKRSGSIAEQIVSCAENRDPVNWSDVVSGTAILVQSLIELKQHSKAKLVAESFLQKQIPDEYLELPHLKKSIKQIKDLCQTNDK